MNFTNSARQPENLLTTLKEKVAYSLLKEMSEMLFVVQHPDSGRVLETIVQLLSDSKMNTLAAICIGNEDDEIVQIIASTMIVRLAAKMDIDITSSEMFVAAAKSFLLLINCENLRRKGNLEYLWPRNIFDSSDDPMAFTKLTEKGKEVGQKQFLEMYEGKGKPLQ